MRLLRAFTVVSVVACALVVGMSGASGAFAAVPVLSVNTIREPKVLPPAGEATLEIEVVNDGNASTGASPTNPIVVVDKLPAGLTATHIESVSGEGLCELATLRCALNENRTPYQGDGAERITVKVEANAPTTLINEVAVSGAGAMRKVSRESLPVGNVQPSFGVEKMEIVATNENGSLDTQAGSHPFQITGTLDMDKPGTKDLRFDMPAGLVGNPTVVPQCTEQDFGTILLEKTPNCPENTVIGVVQVDLSEILAGNSNGEGSPLTVPVFNLVPEVGEPARFGFSASGFPVIIDTSVRTGGDYGVVLSFNNLPQQLGFFAAKLTLWGTPAAPSHDGQRGLSCLDHSPFLPPCPTEPTGLKQTPFLTLPTACSGPQGMETILHTDSWAEPGVFKEAQTIPRNEQGEQLGLDGCNHLPFEPSISVAPDGHAGSATTGLTVGVHVGQEGALNPTGLAPSDVRDTTVTLPAGVQVSPAGAGGLLACSMEQVSLETPGSPTCPEAAKVGTVEIKTPLLSEPLEGAVYLADQNANPFGSLLALYIVAEAPKSGIVIKFAGNVSLDPVSGQLVSTFDNTPPLPFEELKLHFFGSARAPLTTPPLCGSYTTVASITPWSGNGVVNADSTFQITSGPDETPCADPRPFNPGFAAGSTNLQAGAFTPFTLTMSRPDADQTLAGLSVHLPPGLSGSLSKVTLCPEPQASQGACPASSLIGHTVVSAGLGNDPYTVEGGQVFMTGPYKGAPFGLSILNPAVAGPFNLGTVVVRAKVEVDPHTAALTIVADPLPTILDGIPLQIQHVNVTIDRPEFTFNPTNCTKTQIVGSLGSTEGASSNVATPFQVTNCATLAFKPKLTVSTAAKTSRTNGASLHVKLTYPTGPYDANIAKVKVDLPKQLPSRLTTLQKACPAATFEANPAGCPPASIVGHANATTPVLPVGLEGPAYFVSHAGEEFPSLIIVLQGDGVTVDLVGSTFINNKTNVTSSTFKSVPDVPVGDFELTLPQGKYSALAATANLCATKLTMPTAFTGQNGAEIHTSTPIGVTGCAKQATKKTKKKASKHKGTNRTRKKK